MKREKTQKAILKYAAAFLLFLAAVLLAEFAAGLLPQEPIRAHLLESMDQLQSEGLTPGVLYNGHPRSKLDNLSECLILQHSFYMDTRTHPESVLTNPGYQITQYDDTVFDEMEEKLAANAEPDRFYTRYFMGFRAPVRLLLSLMNYMDLRQLLLWLITVLSMLAALTVYRESGSIWVGTAFAFAFSQVNPVAISACVQYSTVFIIAFIGVLLAPLTKRGHLSCEMLCFLIGMATQAFDFFSAPLVTFGLPMTVMLLAKRDTKTMLRTLLAGFGLWLAGYIGTWLFKMLLTSLLTDQNALADGLSRFAYWATEYSEADGNPLTLPIRAVAWCFINILDIVPLAIEAAFVLLCVIRILRQGKGSVGRCVRENGAFLLLACLPPVWFMVVAKPTYNHFYFQYRSLMVFLFSGLVFLLRSAGLVENNSPEP